MSSTTFLNDIFLVKDIDKNGKKFDLVSRIHAKSESYEMEMVLDVNTSIYPIAKEDKLAIEIVPGLSMEGKPDSHSYDQESGPSAMDAYDYVCHGRCYQTKKTETGGLETCVSFGGLLGRWTLANETRALDGIKQDAQVYLLMRKA